MQDGLVGQRETQGVHRLVVVVASNGPKNMCKGPVLVAECGGVQWAVGEGGLSQRSGRRSQEGTFRGWGHLWQHF